MVTPGMGVGLNPKKCRLAPTVKQTGQNAGGELCRNFQTVIFSAVEICKQCLQTAFSTGASPLDPTRWAIAPPQMKNPGASTNMRYFNIHFCTPRIRTQVYTV